VLRTSGSKIPGHEIAMEPQQTKAKPQISGTLDMGLAVPGQKAAAATLHAGTNPSSHTVRRQPKLSDMKIDLGSLNVYIFYKKKRTKIDGSGFRIYVTIRDQKSNQKLRVSPKNVTLSIYGPVDGDVSVLQHHEQPSSLLPSGRYVIYFLPQHVGKYFSTVKFQGQQVQHKETSLICAKKHRFEIWNSGSDSEPESEEEKGDVEPDLDIGLINELQLT